MNEEVKQLLTSIATQLGVKIDQVTQAYVKFRFIDSLRYFLIWLIMFGISIFLLKKSIWFFKLGEDEVKEKFGIEIYDYDPTRWGIILAVTMLTIIFLIITLCNTDWLIWLFAPEGSFYSIIINKFV